MDPESYKFEYLEARQTLELSGRTASQFVRQLGAIAPVMILPLPSIARKPSFQMTVLDQKYWFAKLYEIVSYEELNYSTHTNYPGFSLHFMKVFYGMYYDALTNYLNKSLGKVSSLWLAHFTGPVNDDGSTPYPSSMEAVEFSVRTGATAHIQGDMPIALATAYRTWTANPKPSFDDLKQDFIVGSENAFRKAQAQFYLDVNDKTFSPVRPEVGQLGAAYYQALFNIQPSLPVMFQWRRDAWQKASKALAATP